jgi:hypothetical protein
MNYFKWSPLILISSISSFNLIMSLQPGRFEHFFNDHTLLVFTSYLIGFLFFLAVVVTFVVSKFRSRTSDKVPMLLRRPNNWAIVIWLMYLFMMDFYIPARLAFAFSYSGFQEAIVMPTNQQGKTIGLFKVGLVEGTPSGEVFFQTYTFWTGGNTSWHGFVYKPRPKLSNNSGPCSARFGAYTYKHLFGDWHIFHGSTC